MESAIWGLFGVIIGALSSIITTHLNNRNNINIQRSNEKFKRTEQFRDFQRENLLKLQEKISDMIRLVGRAHFEDTINYKKTNNWQSNLLGAQLDNEINVALRQLSIKAERIDNDKLRNEVKSLKRKMDGCLLAKNYESSISLIESLVIDYTELSSNLGKVIRENYY